MKNTLRSILATPFTFLFISFLLSACTKELVYEAPTQQSSLTISTRGISDIPLPYNIYIFDSKGACTNLLSINSKDSDLSVDLAPGSYIIKAFADAKSSSWNFPQRESAKINSSITPKEGASLTNLAYGSSSVEVKEGNNSSVSLSLVRKMAESTIELNNIPLNATAVKIQIAPVYTSLQIDGQTFNGSGNAIISLEKLEIPGEWIAAGIPIFPGVSDKANITLFITINGKTNSYSYSAQAPQSNRKYNIKGSYTGEKGNEARLNIKLELLPWDETISIDKDFGKDTENGQESGDGDNEGSGDNMPTDFPEVGSIWKNCCVMAISNKTSNSADLLLMSLNEWQEMTTEEVPTTVSSYSVSGISGWRIPSSKDVATISAARYDIGVSSLNTILTNNGGTAISSNGYYLCKDNETYRKYRFSGTVAELGSTAKFRLRVVTNYKWTKD